MWYLVALSAACVQYHLCFRCRTPSAIASVIGRRYLALSRIRTQEFTTASFETSEEAQPRDCGGIVSMMYSYLTQARNKSAIEAAILNKSRLRRWLNSQPQGPLNFSITSRWLPPSCRRAQGPAGLWLPSADAFQSELCKPRDGVPWQAGGGPLCADQAASAARHGYAHVPRVANARDYSFPKSLVIPYTWLSASQALSLSDAINHVSLHDERNGWGPATHIQLVPGVNYPNQPRRNPGSHLSDPLTYWRGATLCPPELKDVALAETVVILMRYAAIEEVNLNTEVQKPSLANALEFKGATMACAIESTPHEETCVYTSVLEGGKMKCFPRQTLFSKTGNPLELRRRIAISIFKGSCGVLASSPWPCRWFVLGDSHAGCPKDSEHYDVVDEKRWWW